MNNKIGIIGLGRTGMPVAQAYLAKGFKVSGYDTDPEKMENFSRAGGIKMGNPKAVAKDSSIILIMVLNDDQVIEVITGENGTLKGIRKKSLIICMSTINRSNLEFVASKCDEMEVEFIDCPFTGGPARIPEGNLTLIAAASSNVLNKAKPVLEVIGNLVIAGNRPGMGQAVKHCNQLLVGVIHAATMEVITMARKAGLDTSLVCEVLSKGIAGNDYFRLLSDSILNNKPSPGGLGQMCKDVSIVVNTAGEIKMPALVANAASQYFLAAEARNMQDREGADLIEIVEMFSGEDKITS